MKKECGFSLIELAVSLVIMAILTALALPAYSLYIQNARIRTTAQMLVAGLQMARSTAVNRNANVEFLLTNAEPIEDYVATASAVSTGINWMIRSADLTSFIEGKYGAEGTGGSTSNTVIPVQICALQNNGSCGAATASVIFSGLGTTNLASAASFQLSNPSAGTCVTAGGKIRCLNVAISVGGMARVCDPAVSATAISAGDTRGC